MFMGIPAIIFVALVIKEKRKGFVGGVCAMVVAMVLLYVLVLISFSIIK